MVAWRPPPPSAASSSSPTASVASAASPCGSRSTSPKSHSHRHQHQHQHQHQQNLLGQHPHSHSHSHGHQQQRAPLSPPLSRPLSPVLILPHSAAIPTATYERRQSPSHPAVETAVKPSQIALPATPPPSPVALPRPRSLASSAAAASSSSSVEDGFVDSPLSTSSPRPSLRRLDTPVFVSPRDPDASEAVLRVGAWVGLTAATRKPAGARRQATI
jgi:hypothetical protein